MRVAIYYPWVYLTSGAERTLVELTGRSRHQWTILTNRFEPDATFPEFNRRHIVELPRVSVTRTVRHAASAALRLLCQKLPLDGYDALVVLCEGLGDLAVLRSRPTPAICVCLTPLRAVFDPAYRERAFGARGWAGRVALSAASAGFAALDRLAWRRYARVFCISEEVRQRALRGRLAPAGRLEVLHVGLSFRPLAPSTIDEPFFLLPGRIMWTKNLELGLEAFFAFRRREPFDSPFRLVVAGAVDRKSEPYITRLRAMAAGRSDVEFRVAPSDRELAALYAACRAALFPAFNEDWGLTPLEAMAFGKPVVATNRGGPRESIRHGIDGFLEEPTPAAFADRLRLLAHEPVTAARMGRTAFERAASFSWDGFVNRIDAEIDGVARARVAARWADSRPAPAFKGDRSS